VHNGYYFILVKGGAVLLLALVAILLTVLRRAWQVHQSADPVDRVIGSSVVAMVVALFLLNFTQPEFSGSAAALVMSLAYPLLSRHSQPAAG
jgi:O-antigen ligase